MFVGWARVELHLPDAASLKDKRQVVRSILDSAHKRMRCAAAEIDFLDLRQRAAIGFSVVSNDASHAQTLIAELVRRADTAAGAEMLRVEQGLFSEEDR